MFNLLILLTVIAVGLLLSPKRGLSVKNYALCFASVLAVFVVGLLGVFTVFHNSGLSIFFTIGFCVLWFCGSTVVATLAVSKFGDKGLTVIKPNSILALHPWQMIKNFVLASLVAIFVAVYCLKSMEINHYAYLISLFVVLPASFVASVIWSGRLVVLKPTTALKTAVIGSLCIFLGSFILGPYFLLGLPLVGYCFIASFLFLQFAYKSQQSELPQSQ